MEDRVRGGRTIIRMYVCSKLSNTCMSVEERRERGSEEGRKEWRKGGRKRGRKGGRREGGREKKKKLY